MSPIKVERLEVKQEPSSESEEVGSVSVSSPNEIKVVVSPPKPNILEPSPVKKVDLAMQLTLAPVPGLSWGLSMRPLELTRLSSQKIDDDPGEMLDEENLVLQNVLDCSKVDIVWEKERKVRARGGSKDQWLQDALTFERKPHAMLKIGTQLAYKRETMMAPKSAKKRSSIFLDVKKLDIPKNKWDWQYSTLKKKIASDQLVMDSKRTSSKISYGDIVPSSNRQAESTTWLIFDMLEDDDSSFDSDEVSPLDNTVSKEQLQKVHTQIVGNSWNSLIKTSSLEEEQKVKVDKSDLTRMHPIRWSTLVEVSQPLSAKLWWAQV